MPIGCVQFDPRRWGRLASMADVQGVTVEELIESAAERLLVGTTRTRQPRRIEDLQRTRAAHRAALTAQVLKLRDRGHTVAGIADLIGYSTTYVSKILCANGARTRTRTDAPSRRISERKTA